MERSKKYCSFTVNWYFILGSSRLSVCLSVNLSVRLVTEKARFLKKNVMARIRAQGV